jgi:hypothetical protein
VVGRRGEGREERPEPSLYVVFETGGVEPLIGVLWENSLEDGDPGCAIDVEGYEGSVCVQARREGAAHRLRTPEGRGRRTRACSDL